MSILKNITSDASIANERDSVGNGGLFESGLALLTITLAYITQAASEAVGLVIHAKNEVGREIRQTLWVQSGKEKGGKNYYEKDGVRNYLPGYLIANSLSLLTVGKELSDLNTETKVVKLYNYDAKAEVPTKVEAVTELIGTTVLAGIIKQTVDKNVKNDAGAYVASGETREENEIDKFFRARDRMTVAEVRAEATEAVFADTWENKWAGQVRNKAKGAAAGGTAGAPAKAAAGTAKPKQSLFA